MGPDYSRFLEVLPDGTIWWLLGDAVKLGAGYLPMRDDHTDLVPVLRALNNKNVADEQGLLSEFAPDRLTEAHPRILVRDGVRFVEAHEFLNWLWKHVKSNPQAAMSLPHALASAVSNARSAEAVGKGGASAFNSLTLALEDWFGKPLDELPVALQLRVRNEYSPMPWDGVNAAGRRAVALQYDLQHDPAMEDAHKYWQGHFEQVRILNKQVEEWEGVATPTAQDLTTKETRLKEIRDELARMDALKRGTRGDYYPEQKAPGIQVSAEADERYIAYPKAMRVLAMRIPGTTPAELAAWIWCGAEDGGIDAYVNANELVPPPRFSYEIRTGIDADYVGLLMGCWFREQDIAEFVPAKRYITGEQLIERWSALPEVKAVPFILAKIGESRLSDMHPTFGGTVATFPEYPDWPPLTSGLFDLSEVAAIELDDFGCDAASQVSADTPQLAAPVATVHKEATSRAQARKLTTQAMYEAWRKAYRKSKRNHPKKSDVWHSEQIAKLPIADGRRPSTIRRHICG